MERKIWLLVVYLSLFSLLSNAIIPQTNTRNFLDQDSYTINFGLQWEHKLTTIYNSPSIADLTGDGLFEIIVGTLDNDLVCLSPVGKQLWAFQSIWQIAFSSAAIADVDNDGFPEILFANTYLYCLSKDGQERWSYNIPDLEGSESSPIIADVDSNNTLDIIFFSNHKVYCLSGFGDLLWSFTLPGTNQNSYFVAFAITDFANDGNPEVITLSNDCTVYCLNSMGELLWSSHIIGTTEPSRDIIIEDLDKDGNADICFAVGDSIYCLNSTGSVQWQTIVSNERFYHLSASDLDGDSKVELLFPGSKGLYCLNSTGSLKWQYDAVTGYSISPTIADFNNDGLKEIIFANSDNDISFLDCNGKLISNFNFASTEISAPISIGDINADGKLELLVPTFGYLYCLVLEDISQSGITSWYTTAGSIYHTGYPDSDGDLIDDLTEHYYQTNPNSSDTDHDGLIDGLEVQVGLNPLVPDANDDLDGDGLTNYAELKEYHTSVYKADTDHDHLNDGWEVNHNHNPLKWDNWALLFGVYLLPAYVIVITTAVIVQKKILKKNQLKRIKRS